VVSQILFFRVECGNGGDEWVGLCVIRMCMVGYDREAKQSIKFNGRLCILEDIVDLVAGGGGF